MENEFSLETVTEPSEENALSIPRGFLDSSKEGLAARELLIRAFGGLMNRRRDDATLAGTNNKWSNPEQAWHDTKEILLTIVTHFYETGEWEGIPYAILEATQFLENFIIDAKEQAALHPENLVFQRLAEHAENMAKQLRSSQPETPNESSNAPRLKWQWTDRAFIRLFTMLSEQGAIPYHNEDNHMAWEALCNHFERKDGTPFSPQQLSAEASKTKESRIKHGDEIAEGVRTAKAENERAGAPRNASPKRKRSVLSESDVSKSARGEGVRSETRR